MGIEPTSRGERDNGFEDRDGHQAAIASAGINLVARTGFPAGGGGDRHPAA